MKKILITTTKVLLYFVGWALLVSFIPVPDFENPAIWRFAAGVDSVSLYYRDKYFVLAYREKEV